MIPLLPVVGFEAWSCHRSVQTKLHFRRYDLRTAPTQSLAVHQIALFTILILGTPFATLAAALTTSLYNRTLQSDVAIPAALLIHGRFLRN